jgi:di/tricarboxylate transporter
MVLPSSFVAGSTLKGSNFMQKTGLTPIGIFRKGHHFTSNLFRTKVKTGDILIVEGPQDDIMHVRHQNSFIVLTQHGKVGLPNLKKGFIALGIFALCVITATVGLLPTSIAFLSGVLLTMSFKVLPPDVVYAKVDWRLIILIGGMTAFGTAIRETGGDVFLAGLITDLFSGASNLYILLGFMILTVLLTQPMSNAAAALVVLPIALETAHALGADQRSFCIGIILSASISMVTPFEPASLLVLGPGNYKISHFFKIGGVLTVICLGIILFMMEMLYEV